MRFAAAIRPWLALLVLGLAGAGAAYAQEAAPAARASDAAAERSDLDRLLADAGIGGGPAPEPIPQPPPLWSRAWDGFRALPPVQRARERLAPPLAAFGGQLLAALPERERRGVRDLRSGVSTSPEARWTVVEALALFVAALLAGRLIRGRGDLAVDLEYPPELRGTFAVRLRGQRRGEPDTPRVTSPVAAKKARARIPTSGRRRRELVARETHFFGLPARRFVVCVDGFLQTASGDAVVTPHFDEREVRIRRGRTVRVEFDFHPRECPVDVKVLWDHRPVAEALVALRGRRDSVRYVRGAPVRVGASRGEHILVVGSSDRVAERRLGIESFEPVQVTLDLTNRAELVFTGCPPAVEPYVLGDVPAAARALEADGQVEVSHLMLARFHEDGRRDESAAVHFEAAGHPLKAAELRASLSDFEGSARLLEQAGELERAAEMYRSGGDLIRAGESYRQAKLFESAVECFREAEDVERWLESLEQAGRPFEAARLAIEHDDWRRAIRSLQVVSPDDGAYLEAAGLLIDAYEREGHLDLAARKVKEILQTRGAEHAPLEACDRLAARLEESGDLDLALDMLEIIRDRDVTYAGIATRIEDLRKRRSAEGSGARTPSLGSVVMGGTDSRYELLEEIGRGGMGIVFKARDRRLGRVVALKRLPDNLRNHPKAVELFLREARAAAALNHANIVTLFDAGQEGDTYYITMELMEGAPLQKIVRKRGKLGPRDAARLGIQVANGLQYAHEQRIVHRDIKTANLFFTRNKVVKIMDFGLAKMVEEVRRSTTVIGGTPYYMAPEQSVGGQVDARADIYALGVTLYEMVCGRVPFDDGDVAYHHRHTPPPDPRELTPELPDVFAELILHMLAKSPDDRCGSASRVGERLLEISRALS